MSEFCSDDFSPQIVHGVRHFMREVWLYALAFRAHLPATTDFGMPALLCELSNEREQRDERDSLGEQIRTFDFMCTKSKILPPYVKKRWKR